MSELAQPSRRRCEHHNARAVSSGRPTRQYAVCESAAGPAVRLRRRGGAAPGRGRLPRVHRRRHHGLPRGPPRQAAARRGARRGRQDRAGQGRRGGDRRRVWCACSATRASTRPARSTSGTTPSSCCGSPRARVASRGTRPATTCSARSSCSRVPLLTAIRRTEPTVLLVDEIDKADVEVEGLLLEVLSDFQVTVPEMGTVTAARRPFALLTSNSTRELSEALKRRCLFLHLDFPDADLERRIVLVAGAGAGRAAGRRAGAHGAGAARAGAAQGARRSPRRSTGAAPCSRWASTPSTTTPCGPRSASSSSTSPTP